MAIFPYPVESTAFGSKMQIYMVFFCGDLQLAKCFVIMRDYFID